MIEKKTWEEFANSGMLWLINRTLHIFGWAIVFEYGENKNVITVYPARVEFRGFTKEIEVNGFKNVSNYLHENLEELHNEVCGK